MSTRSRPVTTTIAVRTNRYLEALNEKAQDSGSPLSFSLHVGRRYIRVVYFRPGDNFPSSHAFVDRETGDVYKGAAYGVPAKGARYNLLDGVGYKRLIASVDPDGKYLMLKRGRKGKGG